MIPFEPTSNMNLWFRAWRSQVRNAYTYPDQSWGYSQAAVLAQAQYQMLAAQEVAKEKQNG